MFMCAEPKPEAKLTSCASDWPPGCSSDSSILKLSICSRSMNCSWQLPYVHNTSERHKWDMWRYILSSPNHTLKVKGVRPFLFMLRRLGFAPCSISQLTISNCLCITAMCCKHVCICVYEYLDMFEQCSIVHHSNVLQTCAYVHVCV